MTKNWDWKTESTSSGNSSTTGITATPAGCTVRSWRVKELYAGRTVNEQTFANRSEALLAFRETEQRNKSVADSTVMLERREERPDVGGLTTSAKWVVAAMGARDSDSIPGITGRM